MVPLRYVVLRCSATCVAVVPQAVLGQWRSGISASSLTPVRDDEGNHRTPN